jgi:hypothetical protein
MGGVVATAVVLVPPNDVLQDDPDSRSLGQDRDPAGAFAVGLVLDLLEPELVGVILESSFLVVGETPVNGTALIILPPSAAADCVVPTY